MAIWFQNCYMCTINYTNCCSTLSTVRDTVA
ncbi:unnamed protein product [Acanthoscelides obtectus]|uniref:Uncharacterized protein n=1 Tax=Acanthoscelides obtectus TaxID=200917 RepID=A0A9P0P2U0_ACAOB|nr:unnamed protein product [Acanthoscelides obtectus]CAK1660333.1 hypothetical protein AOBTE_LOCUS22002 [Acanthoscelides obtectus]